MYVKGSNEAFSRGERDADVGVSSGLSEKDAVDNQFELAGLPSSFANRDCGVDSNLICCPLTVVHKTAYRGDVLSEDERERVELGGSQKSPEREVSAVDDRKSLDVCRGNIEC